MKLKINELMALVYGDIFDFPLTRDEMKLWQLTENLHKFHANLREYGDQVRTDGGFYFLKGRERLVRIRKEREKVSKHKLIKLSELIKLIKWIPTVEGIFATGSVAVGNAKPDADLDLMIVTKSGTLWLTRLVVVGLLKITGSYRGDKGNEGDRVCTNIFIDTDHLEVRQKNLYTAHEVLQAKCLFDPRQMEKEWLKQNQWVENFLPFASKIRRMSKSSLSLALAPTTETRRNDFWEFLRLVLRILVFLPEVGAFMLQYFYMRTKITNEQIGWGQAFFHPRNLSLEVNGKFERRIKEILA